MKVYKMGEGPLYTFYRPYHLSPLEAPNSVARAVLFGDNPVRPLAGPVCDVVTLAKRNLAAGEVLDGIGGYLSYGAIDNTSTAMDGNLLPIGLSEGCTLRRDLPMDAAITFADVEMPEVRTSDRLWLEQAEHFGLHKALKIA
jgi:predicted homoserine dehydrogenase-like protein